MAQNDGQEIIKIVGDAACELADPCILLICCATRSAGRGFSRRAASRLPLDLAFRLLLVSFCFLRERSRRTMKILRTQIASSIRFLQMARREAELGSAAN